ncbi:MAG: hypothetical protein HY675_07550 [Chloroflexi bacterium]|nr:hypothetical protein [Chloroflexota bacterium]
MFWLKQCSKCHGDLYSEREENGLISIVCLQCGRVCTAAEQRQLVGRRLPAALQLVAA